MSIHSAQNLSGFGNAVVLRSYVNPLKYCDVKWIHRVSSHAENHYSMTHLNPRSPLLNDDITHFFSVGINGRYYRFHIADINQQKKHHQLVPFKRFNLDRIDILRMPPSLFALPALCITWLKTSLCLTRTFFKYNFVPNNTPYLVISKQF